VLIIEDHSDAAESLREALELSGHVVDVAQDGSEGIDMARARRPDAILCDIGLPLVDGYAVARLVREDPMLRDVLLVALSGYALQDDIDRSLEAGFDQHMAKPPRLDQLERLLSEAPRRAVTE
jgi:CheY-like chemotaxis protein